MSIYQYMIHIVQLNLLNHHLIRNYKFQYYHTLSFVLLFDIHMYYQGYIYYHM